MNEVTSKIEKVIEGISQLEPKSSNDLIIAKVNELVDKVNSMKERDRGPKSTQSMTEDLANKVLLVEPFCKMSHKKAANELGLSYGQVSSVRGGYTFKNQYKLWREAGSKETWSRDYIDQ